MDSLTLDGFKRPVPKKTVFDVHECYDEGNPLTLIPELCEISAKKARAILSAGMPETWRDEYQRSKKTNKGNA